MCGRILDSYLRLKVSNRGVPELAAHHSPSQSEKYRFPSLPLALGPGVSLLQVPGEGAQF